MGILFFAIFAVFATLAHAQSDPHSAPAKPKAAIIRPTEKPDDGNNFTMTNRKFMLNADDVSDGDGANDTADFIKPPALPEAKSKLVSVQEINGIITPSSKPLIISVDEITERVNPSQDFEEKVIVRYTNDVEERTAGARGQHIEINKTEKQQEIHIRETNDRSPFQTDSLPRAGKDDLDPVIIFFKERSPDLEVGQLEIINSDVYDILRRNKSRKVSVYGYAESGNASQSANDLSMSRALLISEYLVDMGIDPERIEARSMGTDTPISPKNRADVIITN